MRMEEYLVKGGGTWGSVSWMGMEEYILVNGGGRWGSVSWMVEEYLVKGGGTWGRVSWMGWGRFSWIQSLIQLHRPEVACLSLFTPSFHPSLMFG